MSLVFEPDCIAFDAEERVMRLFAVDGVVVVKCAISKAALDAMEEQPLGDPNALAQAYHRHRERILELLQHKHSERQMEPDGAIVVRADDLWFGLSLSCAGP